jgi:hypothetical protein
MQFIKQLSEDEFVVKMSPQDADPNKHIVLAHDYLMFTARDWTCTDMQIKGPYGFANVVHHQVSVQIPIRMAQDILKNVLTSKREYLQESHLQYNGEPHYCDQEGDRYYYTKDDGTKMVAIYDASKNEYIHISIDLENLILKNHQNA